MINHFTQLLYQFSNDHMWWSNKTSNSPKCCNAMFHMFHDFVVILYLSHYYHIAMFQSMRNSCCIHMLHHYYSQQLSMKHTQLKMLHMHVSVTMAWWDRWCTCLWNEMQLVEAKHLRCYTSFHVAKKHLLVFIVYTISQVTRSWSLIEH